MLDWHFHLSLYRMRKKVIIVFFSVICLVLLGIQWIENKPNNTAVDSLDITKGFPTSYRVNQLLQHACYDCHSNLTAYPWYASYQPVGLYLEDHVNEGKRHLNFNNFLGYRPWMQFHKMEEVIEMLEEKEMPLTSYTWLHENAKMDSIDRKSMILWAEGVMDSLGHLYPKDSLINPRNQKK
ncbi:MAG: cytochrome C [Flavobacteriales bacterium]|nr:cytochrome C [Flavobacteriaceae bacterium]PHX91839.1 MAG: cytochrome C [Flavobacteriales bacterium]